ncbi:hypothetical protein [Staphylococcus aureus]|uniref:hypothetical protein n=1 Tax=Staphylococcus aureus TaxID=1280 RepID=UPI000450ABAC|nr:hypothetical protein [Staphylococcus aureus]EWN89191.1 hypothetical protein Q294_00582 [Staphylococcus aureus M1319]
MRVGAGPQQREIGFPISTDNASWGGGPNKEKLDSQFLQTMQVGAGPQQREIGFPISTDNASWGGTTK